MRLAETISALALAAVVTLALVPTSIEAQEPRPERQARPAPPQVQQAVTPAQLELTSRQARLRMAGGFIKFDGVDGESSRSRRAPGGYIKIDGVEGESSRSRRAPGGEIDVLSWSWGSSRHAGGGGGGRIALRSLDQVTVTARADKSSPKLAEALSRGQRLGTIVLEAKPTRGSEDDYVRYTLTDVIVTSVRSSGSSGGGDVPTESVSLSFTKIEVDYQGQEARGLLGVPARDRATR